jgi:hypothetical protein
MHSRAPFTASQVEALVLYQTNNIFHPYTCSCEEGSLLVPNENGLYCPSCRKNQTWAVNWTTDLNRIRQTYTFPISVSYKCPSN